MIEKKWDEASIRAEIARLDKKTGLKGADLPITFGNAKCTLGCFHIDSKTHAPKKFTFSLFYYNDPNWPMAEALDTIRHEYAHYMDYMIYGNCGHGRTWKKCCNEVGARPVRLYQEEVAENARKKEEHESQLQNRFSQYIPGMVVIHPIFGTGCIKDIIGDGLNRKAHVEFCSVGTKYLSIAWIDGNCKGGLNGNI